MLDVSVSYNRYKFIGHEFLTWLWFMIENEPEKIQTAAKDLDTLTLGNSEAVRDDLLDTLFQRTHMTAPSVPQVRIPE